MEDRSGLSTGRGARWWPLLAAGAAVIFLGLGLHAASRETPTVDEFAHVPAGLACLKEGAFELYGKNPPLFKMLLATPLLLAGAAAPDLPTDAGSGWAPWEHGRRFLEANRDRYLGFFLLARAVVVACALLAGWLLYRWARELAGIPAASIVTTLFFLDPNVLAHGHLATLDVAALLSILLAMYMLRRAALAPSWRSLALAGVAWGLALSVKFTAALLLPVVVVLLASRSPRHLPTAARGMVTVGAVALLTVNLTLGFAGTGRALGSYALASGFARSAQLALPSWLPVPLPAAYVAGFDAQKRDTEQGEFPTYLFGSWSREGPWYYDLVALAVKTPLPALALFVGGLWSLARGGLARTEKLAIAAPVFVILFVMAFLNTLKIGVRYLLPALPFLYLAGAMAVPREPGRRATAAALLLVLVQAGTVALAHPAYLSYFNPLAGGEAGGHRILLDSNLDWGQDLYRLPAALAQRGHEGKVGLLYFGHVDPALYGIEHEIVPSFPVPGLLAVSVNFLMGAQYAAVLPGGGLTWVREGHLAWLREQRPIARCGSIWIFDTRPGPATIRAQERLSSRSRPSR